MSRTQHIGPYKLVWQEDFVTPRCDYPFTAVRTTEVVAVRQGDTYATRPIAIGRSDKLTLQGEGLPTETVGWNGGAA